MMTVLTRYLHEPMNALTHLVGVLASLGGLLILLVFTRHDLSRLVTMIIFGTSMLVLYTASSLLHGIKTSARKRFWLNRLDHAAIFVLIAGTYTPIAYHLFPSPWNWLILATVWTAVSVGVIYKITSRKIHGFFNVTIFVILSWGGAIPLLLAAFWLHLIPWPGMMWLVAGGVIYSLGFAIYYCHWPDPWPGTFGHHEIWHLFVLAGNFCHYIFILSTIALI